MNNYMNIYYMNMADNAQSSRIAVRKIYSDGDPFVPLEGRERTWVLQHRLNGIGVKDMDTIIHHFYIYRNSCVCPYEM
jgi:hypothetical protein